MFLKNLIRSLYIYKPEGQFPFSLPAWVGWCLAHVCPAHHQSVELTICMPGQSSFSVCRDCCLTTMGAFIIDSLAFPRPALTYSHTCKHSTRGIQLKPLMQLVDLGKLVTVRHIWANWSPFGSDRSWRRLWVLNEYFLGQRGRKASRGPWNGVLEKASDGTLEAQAPGAINKQVRNGQHASSDSG